MSSFNHKIWAIDPADMAWRRKHVKLGGGPLRWIECSANRCVQEVSHTTSYMYASGRNGRITRGIRHVCPEHAAKFAKKHGLELAPITTTKETE